MKRGLSITLMMFILPLSLLAGEVHADILVEPFVGYMPMGSRAKTSVTNENLSGVIYGARLGWSSMLGPQLGLDYTSGSLSDSASPSAEITPSLTGLFVGWEFPLMLRAWGVLGLSSSIEAQSSGITSTYKEGGKYTKIGLGFTSLPFVNLTLEYITTQHDMPNGAGSYSTSGLILGASLPLEL